MKLCINLNLRAEKQNYYLTSLNYVVTIFKVCYCYFPFPVFKQESYFFKKKIHIFCVYYLLSQSFLYLKTVKLTKLRNNSSGDEFRMGLNCFKKRVLSNNFQGNRKKIVKTFFCCRRIWKTQEKMKFRFIQKP